MNPDPSFLYPSKQHAAGLTVLEYAIESQASFCLLTGEVGSGKTTLVRHLMRSLSDRFSVGLVSNTHAAFQSVHPWVISALGICPHDCSDVAQFEALNDFFIREYGKGRRTLLVFDEAQNLSIETLEELRLLSNVNSEKDVVVQTLLVGQPELRQKLARAELRQFAQRVAVDFHLNSLTLPETHAYIRHRWAVAGGVDTIFEDRAVELIHKLSGGIPRLINQFCDLSLVYAYADRREWVDAQLVAAVVKERFGARGGQEAAAGVVAGAGATAASATPSAAESMPR